MKPKGKKWKLQARNTKIEKMSAIRPISIKRVKGKDCLSPPKPTKAITQSRSFKALSSSLTAEASRRRTRCKGNFTAMKEDLSAGAGG